MLGLVYMTIYTRQYTFVNLQIMPYRLYPFNMSGFMWLNQLAVRHFSKIQITSYIDISVQN